MVARVIKEESREKFLSTGELDLNNDLGQIVYAINFGDGLLKDQVLNEMNQAPDLETANQIITDKIHSIVVIDPSNAENQVVIPLPLAIKEAEQKESEGSKATIEQITKFLGFGKAVESAKSEEVQITQQVETTEAIENKPTLSPEITGGIEGIPDPKMSNPELFDIVSENTPIVKFDRALRMVDYSLDPEQVIDSLTYVANKTDGSQYFDLKGNPYIVLAANFDPDPNKVGEIFEKQPLFSWTKERGWKELTFAEAGNISGFKIGTQLSTPRIKDVFGLEAFNLVDQLVLNNYNHVILESLNWVYTEGEPNNFWYGRADDAIKLANSSGIYSIEGDDLIYHRQNFKWTYLKDYLQKVEQDGFSKEQIKNELTDILINHVTEVVKRNKGNIRQWSTVNEYKANNQDLFYKYIGPEYVGIAFQAARNADLEALLFYNNFDNETRTSANYKQDLTIIEDLSSKGLVDAIGLQMHLDGSKPPPKKELIETMISYGVPVIISSYDLDMRNVSGSDAYRYLRQAEITKYIIDACIESGVCRDFCFWDCYGDKYSWKEDPRRDNTSPKADPTPFTDEGYPKPLYYALINSLLISFPNK